MDLTNSLIRNQGNVVGIVRAELMLAKHLHELCPSVRFSVVCKQGFKEVSPRSLKWLWQSDNINDDYVQYQKNKRKFWNKLVAKIDKKLFKLIYCHRRHHRPRGVQRKDFIVWPYKAEDMVFSCGGVDPRKEDYFSKVKNTLPDVKLLCTIYDLAPLQDTLAATDADTKASFTHHLRWISQNCNAIIYGGKPIQTDAEKYFKEKSLPILPGFPIRWGCDITAKTAPQADILTKFGIHKPFILSVGSCNCEQNYQVLYQAYCWAGTHKINLPSLVIVSKTDHDCGLSPIVLENPLVKDKIKIVSATDEELNTLYAQCLFTVLPTCYEGWTLIPTESLARGKLCVCSDTTALRATGENLACYLDPHHPVEWAKTIADFAAHPNKIKAHEQKIHKNWHLTTWKQAADMVLNTLTKVSKLPTPIKKQPSVHKKTLKRPPARLYYDLSLMFAPLSGIPRTQMLLARYLYQIRKDIEFFYMDKGDYYYIPADDLPNLLGHEKIDVAVKKDKTTFQGILSELPFKKGDVVYSTNGWFDKKTYLKLLQMHNEIGFTFISTIFDFTPITVPHTHPIERVERYPTFLKNLYELSNYIIYGGKTAQKDGENFQKENHLPIRPSLAIKWGNDLVSQKHSLQEIKNILERCGVTGDYILTVGTIEARKNQQILYDAYLEMLRDETMKGKMPQLIICGHPGWKTDAFVNLLKNDERVKDKIIMFSPTDEELDVLYQNCKFTCLASIYEGWSLTLPESLNYGKFCLTADTPSLKETGEDIVDYADPYDPQEWAEKIKYYLLNPAALQQKENLIKEKWHNTTWYDCAKRINEFFVSLNNKEG